MADAGAPMVFTREDGACVVMLDPSVDEATARRIVAAAELLAELHPAR